MTGSPGLGGEEEREAAAWGPAAGCGDEVRAGARTAVMTVPFRVPTKERAGRENLTGKRPRGV